MAAVSHLGKRKWREYLLTTALVLASSGCSTSLPVRVRAEPRTQWVLADLPSGKGETIEVVGHPKIYQDRRAGMMEFDGRADGLIFSADPLEGLASFTIELLIRPDVDGPPEQRFFHTEDKAGRRVLVELRLDSVTRHWCLDTYLHASPSEHRALIDRSQTHSSGEWHWVSLVYDGSTMAHYVDAVKEQEGPVRFPPMSTGQTSIGVRLNRQAWFKGAIREVRIYDRALAADQLSR